MKSTVNVWIVPTTELKKDTIDYVTLWMRCKMADRYIPLAENSATSINTIVRDIEALTDSLNTTEELNEAWSKIQKALGYLSAKDSMFKYKSKEGGD